MSYFIRRTSCGSSFLTLHDVKQSKRGLKRGDVIQIYRSVKYMHTVLYEDDSRCYHIQIENVSNPQPSSGCDLEESCIGTHAFIRSDTLEYILRRENDTHEQCMLRINNQEAKARRVGLDVEFANSGTYLDDMFCKLYTYSKQTDESGNEISVPYHSITLNCETYAYHWKYGGKGWSPQVDNLFKWTLWDIANGALATLVWTGVLKNPRLVAAVRVGLTLAFVASLRWDTIQPNLMAQRRKVNSMAFHWAKYVHFFGIESLQFINWFKTTFQLKSQSQAA